MQAAVSSFLSPAPPSNVKPAELQSNSRSTPQYAAGISPVGGHQPVPGIQFGSFTEGMLSDKSRGNTSADDAARHVAGLSFGSFGPAGAIDNRGISTGRSTGYNAGTSMSDVATNGQSRPRTEGGAVNHRFIPSVAAALGLPTQNPTSNGISHGMTNGTPAAPSASGGNLTPPSQMTNLTVNARPVNGTQSTYNNGRESVGSVSGQKGRGRGGGGRRGGRGRGREAHSGRSAAQ